MSEPLEASEYDTIQYLLTRFHLFNAEETISLLGWLVLPGGNTFLEVELSDCLLVNFYCL
jgi:hypothetical protein